MPLITQNIKGNLKFRNHGDTPEIAVLDIPDLPRAEIHNTEESNSSTGISMKDYFSTPSLLGISGIAPPMRNLTKPTKAQTQNPDHAVCELGDW